jgi:hypothetical protein
VQTDSKENTGLQGSHASRTWLFVHNLNGAIAGSPQLRKTLRELGGRSVEPFGKRVHEQHFKHGLQLVLVSRLNRLLVGWIRHV